MTLSAQDIAHHVLDVRPLIKGGVEPFNAIMDAVGGLSPGQSLLLIAPFKPAPLFSVMERKGFSAKAESLDNGDWQVLFSPRWMPRLNCVSRIMLYRRMPGRSRRVISIARICSRLSRWCAFLPNWKICPQVQFCSRCCTASLYSSFPNSKTAVTNGSAISMKPAPPIVS